MQETGPSYVYVISRLDLPVNHLTVQVAHAAIAATHAYGQPRATHPHLVVCAVPDERALEDAFEKLKAKEVKCCAFYEEDMGNQLTAVATAPIKGPDRKPLKRFRLLPDLTKV